ncbi:hypothetical protein FOA52_007973 [Chlamydomonas sp. UWO 241]|nr:hypothetical protein FOA52_007973 [Chlamydomonas sp. UWO 241]
MQLTINLRGDAVQKERCLLNAGFDDIFRAVKAKENDAALSHLPGLLAELDACASARARWEQVLRGVFAGNIFDLGAANSAALYENNGAAGSFASTRDTLLARPWAIDDLARMLDRLAPPTTTNADNTATTNDAAGPAPGGGPAGGAHAATTLDAHAATARGDPRRHRPYAKAVLFVDNAGSDVVLGMLPLARELLRAGAEVVLAANAAPSCNDVTVPELECVLRIAALLDATLAECVASGALRVVASHSERLPVIDLAALSDGAASECECADLVVLEGMGRAIESNLYARFSGADVWKLGMIKHRPVAESLGGRLYDCVCRYDAAADERAV